MRKLISSLTATVLLTVLTAGPGQAGSFTYGSDENVVYFNDFDDASGLTLANPPDLAQPGIAVAGGELHGTSDCTFCNATHAFAAPISVDDGPISAYFSFRTDISTGEEQGKAYLKMNLANNSNPGAYNADSVTLNVRPGSPGGYYAMFVDRTGESTTQPTPLSLLTPPANTFTSTATYESFKMVFTKLNADEVEIAPFWFNQTTGVWEALGAKANSPSPSPLIASIATDFNGLGSFTSTTLQFAQNIPYADAFAVTQVPEPSSVVGLLALGLLGAGWQYKRRQPKA